MKKYLLLLLIVFLLGFAQSSAQSTGSIMAGGGLDLLKSDIKNIADKAQVGFEVNYFLLRNYSVTGGLEIWTPGNESFILGMRWYPVENIFVRFRGLIGEKSEVSLGAGYWRNIDNHWRFEGMADLYFQGDVAFRAGVAYLFR